MPQEFQEFDLDRLVRDYHRLTPSQRDAAVRVIIRAARVERARAVRRFFGALAAASWKALLRGWRGARAAADTVGRRIAAGWRHHLARRELRLAAARLHAMDDRLLADIGLTRGEIDFALSGTTDPTRIPRPPSRTKAPLAAEQPKPGRIAAQRADLPLVLRNACAG